MPSVFNKNRATRSQVLAASRPGHRQEMTCRTGRRCMMRKVLVTTIATLATAMLFTMTAANAATYEFTFQSNDSELTATGQFTVNAADEVTGVSGAVSGLTNQAISGVDRQSELPELVLQPRRFVHLRQSLLLHRQRLRLSAGCCSPRRENPGGYWNLWATSPGAYSLYESGWQLQLSDPGDRDSERRRGHAGTVDLGDAGYGLCGPLLRWPPPARAAPRSALG